MSAQQQSFESYVRVAQCNPSLKTLLKPVLSKYIPHKPTAKQQAFLWLNCRDAFFGGQAGGGKSDALLMAALQYVDIPKYNAILIRDTYANLTKPEGLLDRAHEWLQNTDAKWTGDKQYVFPSGATLSFSYLDGPLDHFNHQSAAYQFVGLDECVNIRENQAIYMFSRLRKLSSIESELRQSVGKEASEAYKKIPLRFRCAANPPTAEQLAKGAWVKKRYIDPTTRADRVYIPASMDDNPHLDVISYEEMLKQLDPITYKQLRFGDWDIKVDGRMFDRHWFDIVDQCPKGVQKVRYWDLAATEKLKSGHDPDWTAGCKISKTENGLFFIEDMQHFRKKPQDTKEHIYHTAQIDGKEVDIQMEQEGGSSGKIVVDDYLRLLSGYTFAGVPSTGSKRSRARPFASQAQAKNIVLVNGSWIKDFLDELDMFPDGAHDDQVDAASGAFNALTQQRFANVRWI